MPLFFMIRRADIFFHDAAADAAFVTTFHDASIIFCFIDRRFLYFSFRFLLIIFFMHFIYFIISFISFFLDDFFERFFLYFFAIAIISFIDAAFAFFADISSRWYWCFAAAIISFSPCYLFRHIDGHYCHYYSPCLIIFFSSSSLICFFAIFAWLLRFLHYWFSFIAFMLISYFFVIFFHLIIDFTPLLSFILPYFQRWLFSPFSFWCFLLLRLIFSILRLLDGTAVYAVAEPCYFLYAISPELSLRRCRCLSPIFFRHRCRMFRLQLLMELPLRFRRRPPHSRYFRCVVCRRCLSPAHLYLRLPVAFWLTRVDPPPACRLLIRHSPSLPLDLPPFSLPYWATWLIFSRARCHDVDGHAERAMAILIALLPMLLLRFRRRHWRCAISLSCCRFSMSDIFDALLMFICLLMLLRQHAADVYRRCCRINFYLRRFRRAAASFLQHVLSDAYFDAFITSLLAKIAQRLRAFDLIFFLSLLIRCSYAFHFSLPSLRRHHYSSSLFFISFHFASFLLMLSLLIFYFLPCRYLFRLRHFLSPLLIFSAPYCYAMFHVFLSFIVLFRCHWYFDAIIFLLLLIFAATLSFADIISISFDFHYFSWFSFLYFAPLLMLSLLFCFLMIFRRHISSFIWWFARLPLYAFFISLISASRVFYFGFIMPLRCLLSLAADDFIFALLISTVIAMIIFWLIYFTPLPCRFWLCRYTLITAALLPCISHYYITLRLLFAMICFLHFQIFIAAMPLIIIIADIFMPILLSFISLSFSFAAILRCCFLIIFFADFFHAFFLMLSPFTDISFLIIFFFITLFDAFDLTFHWYFAAFWLLMPLAVDISSPFRAIFIFTLIIFSLFSFLSFFFVFIIFSIFIIWFSFTPLRWYYLLLIEPCHYLFLSFSYATLFHTPLLYWYCWCFIFIAIISSFADALLSLFFAYCFAIFLLRFSVSFSDLISLLILLFRFIIYFLRRYYWCQIFAIFHAIFWWYFSLITWCHFLITFDYFRFLLLLLSPPAAPCLMRIVTPYAMLYADACAYALICYAIFAGFARALRAHSAMPRDDSPFTLLISCRRYAMLRAADNDIDDDDAALLLAATLWCRRRRFAAACCRCQLAPCQRCRFFDARYERPLLRYASVMLRCLLLHATAPRRAFAYIVCRVAAICRCCLFLTWYADTLFHAAASLSLFCFDYWLMPQYFLFDISPLFISLHLMLMPRWWHFLSAAMLRAARRAAAGHATPWRATRRAIALKVAICCVYARAMLRVARYAAHAYARYYAR